MRQKVTFPAITHSGVIRNDYVLVQFAMELSREQCKALLAKLRAKCGPKSIRCVEYTTKDGYSSCFVRIVAKDLDPQRLHASVVSIVG